MSIENTEEGYVTLLIVCALSLGILVGGSIQNSVSSTVITEQATTIVQQDALIFKYREELLLTTSELSFFQEQIAGLREEQEGTANLIAEIEDFYDIDVREARKGGEDKLGKLVDKRLKEFNGIGGN